MYVVYVCKFDWESYAGKRGFVRHPRRGLLPCVAWSEPHHRWAPHEDSIVESLSVCYADAAGKHHVGLVAMHHVLDVHPDVWLHRVSREVEMVPL